MTERIAIVTDSPADIPEALSAALGITVVPALLVMEEQAYEDGVQITREEFYRRLPELPQPPTTAAPSSGSYQRSYQDLFDRGFDRIVSLHVASTISAIFESAHLAARPFGDRVIVVDSGQVSLGLGFQALAAARAAQAGADLAHVLAAIRETRKRVRVVAMLDTLEYLRRGGRVSLLQAGLGAMLRVRLFVELHEGRVQFLERVRTRLRAVNRLWDMVVTQGPFEQFAVLHANAGDEAAALLERLKASLPATPLLVNVNTVIGTHVGPKALGFAAVLRS